MFVYHNNTDSKYDNVSDFATRQDLQLMIFCYN